MMGASIRWLRNMVLSMLDSFGTDAVRSPLCFELAHMGAITVGQGTWAAVFDAGAVFYGSFENTTAVDGDNYSIPITLGAGTYRLRLFAETDANRAIIDIDIGGTEVASFDLYSAVPDTVVVHEQTGIVIAGGDQQLRFRVDGRNVASVGFVAKLQAICLTKTG